jgi:hypothetical protein
VEEWRLICEPCKNLDCAGFSEFFVVIPNHNKGSPDFGFLLGLSDFLDSSVEDDAVDGSESGALSSVSSSDESSEALASSGGGGNLNIRYLSPELNRMNANRHDENEKPRGT